MPSDRPEKGSGVLSPSDLDIDDSEYVVELDDDRYVVSTGDDRPDPGFERQGGEPTDEAARERLLAALAESDARYGITAAGTFDGRVRFHDDRSDDVIANFESLLRWYATQVDEELPPERVLAMLLAETAIADPRTRIGVALERHDLDRSDSIGALLAALA